MAVDDIRTADGQQFWQLLKDMMNDGGLMTYRYLGRSVNTGHDDHTMKLRRDMRNPTGGLRAAPLAICAPHTGGFTDVESVPAPVTYQLHIIDPGHGVKKVEVIPSTIASGRTMGFGEARIVDADDHDRVIAVCSGSGIRLAVAPGEFQPIEPAADIPDTDALPPLHEAFGCRRRADGRWELPELDITTASTSASLHLGPAQVLLEVAAEELAVEAAGTDQLQVEDWTVMFVARGSVGPFVVSGQAWSGADGRTAVHLELRDEGKGDRVVTWGSAIYRTLG